MLSHIRIKGEHGFHREIQCPPNKLFATEARLSSSYLKWVCPMLWPGICYGTSALVCLLLISIVCVSMGYEIRIFVGQWLFCENSISMLWDKKELNFVPRPLYGELESQWSNYFDTALCALILYALKLQSSSCHSKIQWNTNIRLHIKSGAEARRRYSSLVFAELQSIYRFRVIPFSDDLIQYLRNYLEQRHRAWW